VRDEAITIHGDGGQTRDFVYVKDIAAANAFAATTDTATGVLNVAYGERITIKDLATRILQLTGSKSKLLYAPERFGDVKHSVAAVDLLRTAGFAPSSNFDQGLLATVEFFSERVLA